MEIRVTSGLLSVFSEDLRWALLEVFSPARKAMGQDWVMDRHEPFDLLFE